MIDLDRQGEVGSHRRKVSSSSSSKKRSRRSTVVDVPLSSPVEDQDAEKDTELIFHVPSRCRTRSSLSRIRRRSHDSLTVISETPPPPPSRLHRLDRQATFPLSPPFESYSQEGTTRIKLTLPANPTNCRRRAPPGSHLDPLEKCSSRSAVGEEEEEEEESSRAVASGSISGEFTLPTNPPITVTIEPQSSSRYPSGRKERSYPDDQICSPENVRSKERRTSVDPSLKGSSSVVSYFLDLLQPSDNKLAMKLFGSRKGLLKERLRQQRAGHCIIHPCSNFRFYWDLIMLILLITNVIVLPVAIAFFSDEINSVRWITFNVISDAFFLFDIVVNFRTGIQTDRQKNEDSSRGNNPWFGLRWKRDNCCDLAVLGVLRNDYIDEIILEPRLIALNYVKTWFVVDLFSSLPVDYLFLFFDTGENTGGYSIARTGRAIKVLRLVKLLSLLRLLRLSRLVRYIHQWEEVRTHISLSEEKEKEKRGGQESLFSPLATSIEMETGRKTGGELSSTLSLFPFRWPMNILSLSLSLSFSFSSHVSTPTICDCFSLL